MFFLPFKALHIIFVITWFAGLFYIVRLFIYSVEANQLPDRQKANILIEQFEIMKRRLWYGITWPSALLTLLFGGSLLCQYESVPPWLATKLLLVLILYLYHISCGRIYRQQKQKIFYYSSFQLRLWNEVATLFLFAIVFVVIMKETLNTTQVFIGLFSLGTALLLAIKIFSLVSKRST